MAKRSFTLLLLAGLLVLLPFGQAFAQTTGGIRGQVLNKDGEPLPGATVVISNASLGVQQGAMTDAKGEFRVVPLAPGKGYSVRVQFPGMSTITQSDVEVTPGRITVVPFTLRPDKEMQEKIRVVGTTDVVDQDSTTTETTISSEFIDALPILGRNYQDALTLAPGVTDIDGDGNPNIHGARDTDVNTLVDGVSTVDPVDGTVGQQLAINSIQEIEVKTSGASAEFGRAQGGFVTVVTKSGGNDFEGSFRLDWRGNTLDGDGAGIDDPKLHGGLGELGLRDLTFNDVLPALTVSGPIRKDKAWYFLTAEYRQEQDPINALTQAFVQTHKELRVFGKLSWDVSTNHKLVFTATFDPQEDDNLGLNSFTAIESGFTFKAGGRSLVLRETAVFSPNVFLDTIVQHFVTSPEQIPTLAADTNGNGVVYVDQEPGQPGHGFIDATETDPGQDFDRDDNWDVFEDFINKNGRLDTGEDLDRDGRLTLSGRNGSGGGCEGETREDIDCDGRLDNIPEDSITGDIDSDGHVDPGTEDRNGDFVLNDRPFVLVGDADRDENGNLNTFYPYYRQTPLPRDRDYEFDLRSFRVSGPRNTDFVGDRGRQTLRQDLTIFVPDWHGQHELKTGYKIERESFEQTTNLRTFAFPNLSPPTAAAFIPTIGVALPAEGQVFNEATAMTGTIYVQDTYKPLPNLTLNLGLRFDRETTDSFGYTPFDPVAQRANFDRLNAFAGGERGKPDDSIGNNDGISQLGYCSDPLFAGYGGGCGQAANASPIIQELSVLPRVALSRLTQHHTTTELVANNLASLFPNPGGGVDLDLLRAQGNVFQVEEAFRLTNNNLAPRIAISWDPWADSKTKIFASWGRFYDKLFLGVVTPEEGPDTINRYYMKDNDGISGTGVPNNGIGEPISKAPPTAAQIDRGLQTPFKDEWSVGFERELVPEVSMTITYFNNKGRLGLQDKDVNHAIRYGDSGQVLDAIGRIQPGSGAGSSGARTANNVPDLYVYNFFFNQIFRFGNFNTSEFEGIELHIVKRLSRKWQMDASYAYGRARGGAEDFNSRLGDDPATLGYEYGYLNQDQRHVVRFNGTAFLAGDWSVGAVMQWASGLPYSAITTVFDLDNFDYPQNRVLFGRIEATSSGVGGFTPEQRNSRRNDSVLNINLRAEKAFVIGRFNSRLFLTVEDLLNTDDLRIDNYEPDNSNRAGNLQLDAERQFGRRYGLGFQFDF